MVYKDPLALQNKPAYPSKVYLNGRLLNHEDAKISVFDRGFIFGDGIYEVMARINGRFFFKEAHLERLRWCLREIAIDADVSLMEREIPVLLAASGLQEEDSLLYMQVTRGVAPRQHAYPEEITPTIMMYAWPKTLPAINNDHASVVTLDDYRWSRCDIKNTSLLANTMANEHAVKHDCYETLFVRNGIITEASHCNVFFVKNRIVYTHPAGPYILDGITRQVVLELCEELGLKVRLEGIPFAEAQLMDEAFLTGTSTQILAIRQLDEHTFFSDSPGPVTLKLQQAFLTLKNSASGNL